ncbi:MAG: PKD domain-containing protein [bacterium]|nr:PKD domain-containing protein [bacterium]
MNISSLVLRRVGLLFTTLVLAAVLLIGLTNNVRAANEQGSVGLSGTIPSDPPTTGATITVPSNGQSFSTIPVRAGGLCPAGLLVKIFKNNIFAGSQQCTNGSFSIDIDLFTGQNELVARVYDDLDQPGPDSNAVTVNFNDPSGAGAGTRVTITSNFAKRGANPGSTLTWPISISGGSGPYAISVDWGDGKAPDLRSQAFPGGVDLSHIYDSPGVYNIVIKVTDRDGITAFLQVVGVANGPLSQSNEGGEDSADTTTTRFKILWWPLVFLIPFIIVTFWLGRKAQLKQIKTRISRGERPF